MAGRGGGGGGTQRQRRNAAAAGRGGGGPKPLAASWPAESWLPDDSEPAELCRESVGAALTGVPPAGVPAPLPAGDVAAAEPSTAGEDIEKSSRPVGLGSASSSVSYPSTMLSISARNADQVKFGVQQMAVPAVATATSSTAENDRSAASFCSVVFGVFIGVFRPPFRFDCGVAAG